MDKPLHLYFRTPPIADRFIPGDRFVIPVLRRIIKGKRTGGIEKVFINLCKGLQELGVHFDVNLPFKKVKPGEPVIVLGNGKYALDGCDLENPIIAGIALMTHPSEWPDLLQQYPVVKYLQHSAWARDVYIPYYGKKVCNLWPAGIDTEKWSPAKKPQKTVDLLIYNKIRWNQVEMDTALRLPILQKIAAMGLTYQEIKYGSYNEAEYHKLLLQSRAMIFFAEHESQGLACCEALSMDVPVLAWDQGYCLDPNRFSWGEEQPIPATSVPFFNKDCGTKFSDFKDFEVTMDAFWDQAKNDKFNPRNYILEHLTLKKSAQMMMEIIDSVYR